MKNLLLIAMLPATVLMCKQDEKFTSASNNTSAPTSDATTTSLTNRGTEFRSPEIVPTLKVETIDAKPDLGTAIFTSNGNAVISFDKLTQKGRIKINGKEYTLDKLTFSENRYEMKGDGITINANEGSFEDLQTDCLYGVFLEVQVKLNNQETVLRNIKVQDCQNLN